MKHERKNDYLPPEVFCEEFQVENGIAGSDPYGLLPDFEYFEKGTDFWD